MRKRHFLFLSVIVAAVMVGRVVQQTAVSPADSSLPKPAVATGEMGPSGGERAEPAETLPRPPGAAAGTVVEAAFQQVTAFNDWTERWMAADAPARLGMQAEGMAMARQRRPAFKELIVQDPQRALERAVPRVVRQALPQEMVALLEMPVSARGHYHVYSGRPVPGAVMEAGTELSLRYFETPAGESFKARVFGRMEPVRSRKDIPLRGVAVDRELAVAESPLRPLEPGEIMPAGTAVDATCPVSGTTTGEVLTEEEPVTGETPVVEVAGRYIRLCDGSHVRILDDSLTNNIEASGAGGAGFFRDTHPGTSSEAIGNFRCLYLRVTYPDQLKAPNTEAGAFGDMRNVSRFYLESSFGRMTTTSTVSPLIVLPHSQAWYIAKDSEVDGLGLVHSDARSAARKLGYDSNQFNCTIVRVNGGPRLSGISWGGGDSVWVTWDGMDVLNHECGHSLGRNHANYWATTDGTAIGNGGNAEYGNSFDVMGGGSGFGAHYNTISKRALGWLSDPYMHRPVAAASANGIYRLTAYDQPTLEEGQRYGLRVAKDAARDYYLEYHPAIGGQLADQAMLLFKWSGMSNAGHLIDTTPGSSGGKSDGGIQVGRTFSDAEAGLHFTVLSKNATVPPSLEVALQRGPFPENLPPVLSLAASATAVAPGAEITFTATATDPNGDALSYHWDFNDGVASRNAAVLTRVFPSTDQMTVMVTASDMKGGTARAHVVVTAGSPGRGVATGRVSAGGVPVMGARITSAGGKYCYTNSAGNYALSDLPLGAQTLSATLEGYTFTPGFSNPLTIVSGVNAAPWTAGSIPELTLVNLADATEGGASGSFRISRTGDPGAALDVLVAAPTGNAALTTDYTFSPALVDSGLFRRFRLPAGAASLTVAVVPVNDTAAEGPETVGLQFAAGAGYIVRQQGSAFLTLNDNDTSLPQVSLAVTDPEATEAPGDAAAFVIARTGNTSAPLNVNVSFGGTATRGEDYPAPATTVTLPAGGASVTVMLNPVNDTATEGTEDCTLTLVANAGYVINPAAMAASATITDDETPVVTVAALDGTALEAGNDAGVVLITRVGSTAAPLTVYYGLSGSAQHGTDYVELNGRVVIPSGLSSVPVVITPYDDDHAEPTESVTFNLTSFNNTYSIGAAFSASVAITDNNDPPLVSVGAGSSAAEPSTNGTFVIRSVGSSATPITVHYTVSGTAASGVDFTARSGSVTLPGNGSADATVTIPVLNDSIAENTETVVLALTPDPSYIVCNDGSAVVRLKDDESLPVSVSTHSTTPAEPGTAGKFYLSRSNSTGALSVNYTMSGTATNGADYVLLGGSVMIPDGQSGVDLAVVPTDDSLIEGTETVTLTLAAGSGYGAEVPSATLYLSDNETSPQSVGWQAATGSTTEAPVGAPGEFRDIPVTLAPASATPVTVEYFAGGGTATGDDVDWTFVDAGLANVVIPRGLLTFPPGITTRMVRIRVKNDGVQEGSETAILELRHVNGGRLSSTRSTHTLTIADANNPAPRVQFLVAASTVGETDGVEPKLMAMLDRAASSTVTVQYATSGTAIPGTDFILPPATLTFAAGEWFKALPLTILPDDITELAESIMVTLSDPTGATLGSRSTHAITVKETNLAQITLTASTPEAVEGGSPGAFTLSRSGGSNAIALTVYYTLGGTAGNGTDYAGLSGSAGLAAGQSSVTLPVVPVDDTATEPDETIILTLTNDPNYALAPVAEATVTLLDNDVLPVIGILSPGTTDVSIPAGVGLLLHAESVLTSPNGVSQLPLEWSLASGPGTAVFENSTANRTGVTFSAAGSYVIRVSSGPPGSQSTTELKVFHNAPALTGTDVGFVEGTTAAGSWTRSAAAYTLFGSGSGISSSGTADGFYYLATPQTGDFDIKVRLASRNDPANGGSFRAGLMARASTGSGALYAMSLYKADGTQHYQYRRTSGAAPGSSSGNTARSMPGWLRLTRAGDSFSAYYGNDGINWTQRGTAQTIAMGESPLVGFAVTSAAPATRSSAVFDGTNLPLTPNLGPFVHAGAALSGAAPWLLDATVTDDARPLPASLSHQWSVLDGPGAVSFSAASSIDTAVSFGATGQYTLRLTAHDGSISTYHDTTAAVTVIQPLDLWRTATFGADADNPLVSGELADPDQDGLVNLVEYALNLNPRSGGDVVPTASMEAGQLSITYQKNLAATDLTLVVEVSAGLDLWAPAPVVETILDTIGQTQFIKATTTSDGSSQFLRLRVRHGVTPPGPR